MLKNYLKIAYRNLIRQKGFSIINLFGLTVGLVSFLLIALYLIDELTYDQFHKKSENIYRIVETKTSPGGKQTKVVSVAANIATGLKNNFPQVANATRFSMLGRLNVTNGENNNVFYESYTMADSSFLSIFDFPHVAGNLRSALKEPYSVVLTDKTAMRYFGRTDVVGKTINTEGDSIPYRITGVIRIPDNSHLQFNLLFTESSLYSYPEFASQISNDWSSNNYVTYVLLRNKSAAKTEIALNALVGSKRTANAGLKSAFTLQPLKDIHFRSAGLEGNMDGSGNINHIYVFGAVAFLVLLIACINYMNLTTARFAGRSKEVAVRKVAGASRQHLIKQFFTETWMLTLIALLLALGIVKLLLPAFNAFTEKQLRLDLTTDYRVWLVVAFTTLMVGLLSGTYPAFFQSRLKPYLLLKNKSGLGKSNLSVRQVLVIFQFALSIVMIVATVVVYQQMKYVDTADMGFSKNQLLVVDINSGAVRRGAEAIKTEFAKIPGVSSVSVTSRVPGEWKVIPKVKVNLPGSMATQGEDVYYIAADDKFLKTFEIRLLDGRNFSGAAADSSAVLINETFAKMLGIQQSSEQLLEIPSVAFSGNPRALGQIFRPRVIGIVKDFNFQSMREKVGPMILGYQSNPIHNIDYFTSKISTANTKATLKSMEDVLRKVDPSHLFEYNFLDKQWQLFYRQDQKRQTIFLGIAILAIVIACLGLFGLAAFAAEQRVKEIGVRKVLGASVGSIVRMLSKDFAKLVLIGSLIGVPVAWWAMNNWLRDYAYRVHISWWVFILATGIALFIALLTVSVQAVKAAIVNPVKSLRNE